MTTDAPTIALGATPGFVVQLDRFNGPLDLLLHLLREQQIEIADIPIAQIADQFLGVIHELGLNQAADYLDMASRLVRLKAQMLLPRRSEEEGWEDPRAELVRRLLEYQQIKEIALWLAALGRPARAPVRARVPAGAAGAAAAAARARPGRPAGGGGPGRERDPDAGAAPRGRAPAQRRGAPRSASRRCCASAPEISFREALGARPTIVDVLSTLLALLELARRGLLRVAQDAPFAAMVIRRESPLPAD